MYLSGEEKTNADDASHVRRTHRRTRIRDQRYTADFKWPLHRHRPDQRNSRNLGEWKRATRTYLRQEPEQANAVHVTSSHQFRLPGTEQAGA